MDNIVAYCDECETETNHEVLEIKGGVDYWLEVQVKCSKCGNEQQINLFC